MKLFIGLIFSLFLLLTSAEAFQEDGVTKDWPRLEGKHFIVIYAQGVPTEYINRVLIRSEELYDRISNRLGFSKYTEYWTWENRAKIIIFPNAETYVEQTGQPAWSQGLATSHSQVFGGRVIASYFGREDLLTSILPHEIGHLMLHDFMKNTPIPVFFDEGVAQLEEGREAENEMIMAQLAHTNQHIPLSVLVNLRPTSAFDQRAVSIFYAESLYIVDFLIKTYGSDKFVQLCRLMRDRFSFEEAVKKFYYPLVSSIDDLERLWLNHLKIKLGVN